MDKKLALEKAKKMCAAQEKCEWDVRKKLRSWGLLDSNLKDEIINFLVDEKFIDDSRYASMYVKEKFRFNQWGKIKLKYMLKQKMINESIIDHALTIIPDEEYIKTLKLLLEEKYKVLNIRDRYKLKGRLIQYGLQKGYENGKVFDIVNSNLKSWMNPV